MGNAIIQPEVNMQFTRNNQPLTPEEQEELGRLKVMVEKAIADGILSKTEEDMIRSAVLSHHGTHELYYQELQMCRELITEKVNQGLLVAETYDSL
ncbi:MAG: hypothetical protein ACKO5Q_21705 [Microcystaceae cyanobacterium]